MDASGAAILVEAKANVPEWIAGLPSRLSTLHERTESLGYPYQQLSARTETDPTEPLPPGCPQPLTP